jgi:hypothetical protein
LFTYIANLLGRTHPCSRASSLSAAVVVCAITAMPTDAAAGPDDLRAVRAAIEENYRRADALQVNAKSLADIEAIRQWLDTPDCVYADYGQTPRTWSDMRRYAAEGLGTRLKSLRTDIEQLVLAAETLEVVAVVRGVAVLDDRDGRFGARGSSHEVETTATVRDTWTKSAGRWKRKSHIKIVPNRIVAVDGKPKS